MDVPAEFHEAADAVEVQHDRRHVRGPAATASDSSNRAAGAQVDLALDRDDPTTSSRSTMSMSMFA